MDVVVGRDADHRQFLTFGQNRSIASVTSIVQLPVEPFFFLVLDLMKFCFGLQGIPPGRSPGVFFGLTYLLA